MEVSEDKSETDKENGKAETKSDVKENEPEGKILVHILAPHLIFWLMLF